MRRPECPASLWFLVAAATLAVSALSRPAMAQQAPDAHAVVMAGVSSLTLSGALPGDEVHRQTKVIGGLSLRFNDRARVGLTVEFLGGTKNYEEDIAKGRTADIVYLSRFVQVPVLLRVGFGPKNRRRGRPAHIVAGAGIGLRFAVSSATPNIKSTLAGFNPVKKLSSSGDADAIVGAGIEWHRIAIEGRFAAGLTPVPLSTVKGAPRKNFRAVIALFGYRFG